MKDIDKIYSGSDKLKSAISDVNDKILSIKRQVEDTAIDNICNNIIDTNKKIIRELSNGNDLVKKLEDRKNEFKKGYTYYKDSYDELFPIADTLRDENNKFKKEIENLKKENEKLKERNQKLDTGYRSMESSLKAAYRDREESTKTLLDLGQEVYDLKNQLNRKTKELQKIMDELDESETNNNEEEEAPVVVKKIEVEGKKYLVDKLTNDVYDYDIYKENEEQVLIGKYDPKKNKVTIKKSSKK
jgi:chromosome segregation ATPase